MRIPLLCGFAIVALGAGLGTSALADQQDRYQPPSAQGLRRIYDYSWLCFDDRGRRISGCDASLSPNARPPRSLWRPLHLPTLPAHAPCPVSSRRPLPRPEEAELGLGGGPVYAIGFDAGSNMDARLSSLYRSSWQSSKTIFLTAPSYPGPLLIRGHELKGPHWLGFEPGRKPLAELPIPSVAQVLGNPHAWRLGPTTETRIREPGCYGFQIDGTSFSEIVVFRARFG